MNKSVHLVLWILSNWLEHPYYKEQDTNQPTRNFHPKQNRRYIQILISSSKCFIVIIFRTRMGMEIVEPNTCIRGCCSSSSIPLHLPPSSYSLLSPIARGFFFLFFSINLLLPNFLECNQ
jgi:hypothetical protein